MQTPTINPERLAEIQTLSEGSHDDIERGMCVMEAVAYVAGEPWGDAPQCACPVTGDQCRAGVPRPDGVGDVPRLLAGDEALARRHRQGHRWRGMSTATEAAAARGIRVEPLPQPDEWGNTWQAVIPRKGRGTLLPMAATLAGTAEDAARAALQYVGARGWQA